MRVLILLIMFPLYCSRVFVKSIFNIIRYLVHWLVSTSCLDISSDTILPLLSNILVDSRLIIPFFLLFSFSLFLSSLSFFPLPSLSLMLSCFSSVFGELLLGTPLFPGESGVGQLIEIIKILGSPSKEEVMAMNPSHSASFKFPIIKPQPWAKVFRHKAPDKALDLISRWLRYKPSERLLPLDSLAHPFFDELREPGARLPNGKSIPHLYDFTENEIKQLTNRGLIEKVIPPHVRNQTVLNGGLTPTNQPPSSSSPQASPTSTQPSSAASSSIPPAQLSTVAAAGNASVLSPTNKRASPPS